MDWGSAGRDAPPRSKGQRSRVPRDPGRAERTRGTNEQKQLSHTEFQSRMSSLPARGSASAHGPALTPRTSTAAKLQPGDGARSPRLDPLRDQRVPEPTGPHTENRTRSVQRFLGERDNATPTIGSCSQFAGPAGSRFPGTEKAISAQEQVSSGKEKGPANPTHGDTNGAVFKCQL